MTQTSSHHSIGFHFSSDLSYLTLKGAGRHIIDSHDYSWDNRNRSGDYCLVQCCIGGEGALEMKGISYSLLPGDVFLIAIPGESRYYLPAHAQYWDAPYLEFSKECLSLLRKIYGSIGPVIHLTQESGLIDRMLSIYDRALHHDFETFFENSKTAYTFWMDITAYALSCYHREITKIDHAKAYIDQNYCAENLTLDLVASHAGLSKFYMCKEFHKKYGISPGQYIKELRISQACRLLVTNSDYTIQEIAHMVGYSNDNYFGKVFRASKGLPPDAFRKQSNHYDFMRTVYETQIKSDLG